MLGTLIRSSGREQALTTEPSFQLQVSKYFTGNIEVTMLLPDHPQSWDHRCVPPFSDELLNGDRIIMKSNVQNYCEIYFLLHFFTNSLSILIRIPIKCKNMFNFWLILINFSNALM